MTLTKDHDILNLCQAPDWLMLTRADETLMMEHMCKIRCSSEVRFQPVKTSQIIIIFALDLETKPFDISHGYSRPWKQHLGMHQRRAYL